MYKTIFIGIATVVLLTLCMIPSQTMTSYAGHFNIPPYGDAIEHINQAQTALHNGDTEGANNHLELAKKSLGNN
jgi:hypothetical protein